MSPIQILPIQEKVIKRYLDIHKNPTLKHISKDTQIQVTRVFRILNGSEMKLSEYQKFMDSIEKRAEANNNNPNEKQFLHQNLDCLLEECESSLSTNSIAEIREYIKRKLKLSSILSPRKYFFRGSTD